MALGGTNGHTLLLSFGTTREGTLCMEDVATQEEWQSRKIKNWLLTLLRFAVTRDNTDRMCVLEAAREIDHQNRDPDDTSFSFFVRTSAEICNAIASQHDSNRQATLIRYFKCIDDHRLRAALEAATDCRPVESASPRPAKRKREELWRGLRLR